MRCAEGTTVEQVGSPIFSNLASAMPGPVRLANRHRCGHLVGLEHGATFTVPLSLAAQSVDQSSELTLTQLGLLTRLTRPAELF